VNYSLPDPPPVVGIVVRKPSAAHEAWDITCTTGDPVFATHDGTVSDGYHFLMGNYAVLSTDWGRAYYAHLDAVTAKGVVLKGEKIGECGSTGKWSSGPHLHYELHID